MKLRTPGGAPQSSPRRRLDRGLALTVLTGLGLLLVIGVVYSVAFGSRQITTAAVEQQQVAESLRAAQVVRAEVAIAVLLGTLEENIDNVVAGDARRDAILEAEEAIGEINNGLATLSDSGDRLAGSPIPTLAARFIQIAEDDIDDLREGAYADARARAEDFDAAYVALADEYIALRTELTTEIEDADTLLARIGLITRFLVGFFIPAAVIVVYRELVLRRNKELELEHRLEAERQLARAREEFVANASHELRTPLTGIAGMAMLLEEELQVQGSEMSRELVDVIIRESSDLERIVEDLLTTARLDAGALHFSFEDVIVALEAEEAADSLIRNGADVEVRCTPGIVRADRTRLRQIIRNLLSNAIKYGGPNIRIAGETAGSSYVLVIADDGAGLPDPVREHLFERFVHRETDQARTDSVGLGLAIVHALVIGMGGAISYEHTDGESRFTIRLPLAQGRGPAVAAPAQEPEATAAPRGGDG